MSKKSAGMSYETRTIIVIVCLFFMFPVGLVLMWVWMKWPTWVKILLTVLPFLAAFLVMGFVLSILGIVFSNPQVQKSMQTQMETQISQTPQEDMSNWKTYTDSNQEFSFKYAPEWSIKNPTPQDNSVYLYPNFTYPAGSQPSNYFWINKTNNPNNLSFVKMATQGLPEDYAKQFIYKAGRIGNYTTYTTTSLPSQSGALHTFITDDGKRYIVIGLAPYTQEASNSYYQSTMINYLNQILSTLKFTK